MIRRFWLTHVDEYLSSPKMIWHTPLGLSPTQMPFLYMTHCILSQLKYPMLFEG